MKIFFSATLLRHGAFMLVLFLACFAISYFSLWCFDPVNFPILTVRLEGEKKYLREEWLEERILQHIEPGFLKVRVSTLQQALLSLPWIKQADVRKVWPAQIIIQFQEHHPCARWGETSLISQSGILFKPDALLNISNTFNHLPLLQGPQAKHEIVWQQYLEMKKILTPLSLQINNVLLAPRGAWQLSLSNGIKVLLGTEDIMLRLKRFVLVYEKELSSHTQEIAYVDLRYTSGMAIGWKKN